MSQTFPTPNLELNEVLHELVSGIKSVLDKNLVAVFLQGSFALGDWDAGSDVDFLVVLENELPENLLPELSAMHGRIYARPSSLLFRPCQRVLYAPSVGGAATFSGPIGHGLDRG